MKRSTRIAGLTAALAATAAIAPSNRVTPVLQAADEAGTRITQSDLGRIWQVRM